MTENSHRSILILEDDDGIAQLERRRLERAGYRVQVAATPASAREILGSGGIDLLILDYLLNNAFNGLEFYQSLREGAIAVPSILVTGFSDEAMLAQAIRIGIRDFLPKTTDFLDFLVPTVERVLKQVDVEIQLDEAQTQKKILADEDRRKDEFLAMLAHELRNPLAAISSAVHLAKLSPSVEQRAWSDEVISRQVRQLSHLIDDLLDVSRIRLGKIQLRKRAVDVNEIVTRAIETVKPMLDRKKHVLDLHLNAGPLHIDADPTRLEQGVVNLLTNATKYTDDGGRIVVSLRRDGDRILIRVKDSGMGIAPEMLAKIFELFVQVDGSLDRSQGGLGIGLTLVRKLVEMHGGTVSAFSEGPGLGSEFVVSLPVATATGEAGPSYDLPAIKQTTEPRRILVVDDNLDSARGLARLLRSSGHEVAVVHDGPSALDAVQISAPDVILLDIGLPGMDGYQVASAIRAQGLHAAKIIAVSGYGQDDDRRKSKDAGFDHHLVKPIDPDRLHALLAS